EPSRECSSARRLRADLPPPTTGASRGMSEHDDSWLDAVDPGLPGAERADDVALRVERLGVFPEVPHGAISVLRIEVERILGQDAVEISLIVDHRRAHTEDDFPAFRHRHVIGLG